MASDSAMDSYNGMKMLLLTAVVGAATLLTGCHDGAVAVHGGYGYAPGYAHGYGYGPRYHTSYRRPYYARSYPYYGRTHYRSGRYYNYDQPYYGNRTYYGTSSRDYYPGDGVRYATRRVVSAPRRVVRAVVD